MSEILSVIFIFIVGFICGLGFISMAVVIHEETALRHRVRDGQEVLDDLIE